MTLLAETMDDVWPVQHLVDDGDLVEALTTRRDESQPLRHHVETLALPMNALTDTDVQTALQEADKWQVAYEEEARKLEADPKLRDRPRWYRDITMAFG